MHDRPIRQAIEIADKAITNEDFDTLMEFYANDAVLVIKPGVIARGKEQIRKAFLAIAEHFDHNLVVKQGDMEILAGANTALVVMETILETMDANHMRLCTTRRATYVFRREEKEQWLCVVDNSYGTDILKAS